jgi:hypothetical protein
MLHLPRAGFWQRLEREATEKAPRMARSGDPDGDDDDEEDRINSQRRKSPTMWMSIATQRWLEELSTSCIGCGTNHNYLYNSS